MADMQPIPRILTIRPSITRRHSSPEAWPSSNVNVTPWTNSLTFGEIRRVQESSRNTQRPSGFANTVSSPVRPRATHPESTTTDHVAALRIVTAMGPRWTSQHAIRRLLTMNLDGVVDHLRNRGWAGSCLVMQSNLFLTTRISRIRITSGQAGSAAHVPNHPTVKVTRMARVEPRVGLTDVLLAVDLLVPSGAPIPIPRGTSMKDVVARAPAPGRWMATPPFEMLLSGRPSVRPCRNQNPSAPRRTGPRVE